MEILLPSAVISIFAALLWIGAFWIDRLGSAKFRYLLAASMFGYGTVLIPAIMVFIFDGLEIGFVTWGGQDSYWTSIAIFSAILALITSAVLASANVLLIRFSGMKSVHKGDH